MLFRALALLALVTTTALIIQPVEERIVTFKLVSERGEVKNFLLLVFRRGDRKLILAVKVLEGSTISLSLSEEFEYVVGAYTKFDNIVYAGYKRVSRGDNEVVIVLKPLPELVRRLTRIVLTSKKPLTIMNVELLVPYLGVIEKLKVSNQTVYVPSVPLVMIRKEGALTYYGIFLPGDKEIKLVSTQEAKSETLGLAAAMRAVRESQAGFRPLVKEVNLLRIVAIITISLLIAYVSYVTARRYVKQQV